MWKAATIGATSTQLNLNAYINPNGLYIMVEKAAINSLISILGFGEQAIFQDALIELYLELADISKPADSRQRRTTQRLERTPSKCRNASTFERTASVRERRLRRL